MSVSRISILMAFVVGVMPAMAEVRTFEIDPVHSALTFRIRHVYSMFSGRLNRFSGTITGDLDKPETVKVTAEVDVGSIDTANGERDTHLMTADYLDTTRFGYARFESTTAKRRKDGVIETTGDFTLHGVKQKVTFVVEQLGYGPDHRKGKRAGFIARATIKRSDFGMPDSYALPSGKTVIGDSVALRIDIEAIEVPSAAAPAGETLAEKMAAFRAGSKKKMPAETAAALAGAAAEIRAQGGIDGLRPGDTAPNFKLRDQNGKRVSLYKLLKKGPAVVVFFRGGWCPFCNIQMQALQEVYPQLRELGASLVAVAPQKPGKAKVQSEEHGIAFPLLGDTSGDVLRDYRLLYKVPAAMKEIYHGGFGIDLDDYNGEGRWELPVTATFVIGQDRVVAAGEVDLDYKKRMEPADIIAAVKGLGE